MASLNSPDLVLDGGIDDGDGEDDDWTALSTCLLQ